MSRTDNHGYYSRRTAEELERGDQAIDATVAAIHYDLAHRYSILAAQSGTGTPKLSLDDCDKNQRLKHYAGQREALDTIHGTKAAERYG